MKSPLEFTSEKAGRMGRKRALIGMAVIGSDKTHLNVTPSKKSLEKARGAIREKTAAKMCFKPTPEVVEAPRCSLLYRLGALVLENRNHIRGNRNTSSQNMKLAIRAGTVIVPT